MIGKSLRGASAGILMFGLASPGHAQAPPPPPAGVVFPSDVDAVTVDVLVLDRQGRPMENLTREDFTVTEDGRPQTVTTFQAVALPESEAQAAPARARLSTNTDRPSRPERSFVILFDNAHLGAEAADRARAATERFLETGLRPGDRVTVVPTAGGAWWTAEMPGGYSDLQHFLARLEGQRVADTSAGRISDYEALRLHVNRDAAVMGVVARRYYENGILVELPRVRNDTEGLRDLDVSPGLPLIQAKAAEVYRASLNRSRQTLHTLERVLLSLASSVGRKSVLMVSEGFVYDPTLDEFKDVVRASRRANAAVYFVDASGGPTVMGKGAADAGVPVEERDVLTLAGQAVREVEGAISVAADTGGASFRNVADIAGQMSRVAQESGAYYLIGYQSTNPKKDGKFRKIEVTVRRDAAVVRARRGYYAPGGPPRKPERDELDPSVREALDAPLERAGLPLRMTSYVFATGAAGKASVLLVAEADPRAFAFTDKAGRFEASLDSFVVVASRDTGENFHREKRVDLSLPAPVKSALERSWLPLVRDFDLPPGAYQARLLLREEKTGRVGTVRHDFEVPPPNELRVSTPILTDATQADPAGGPPRPVPIARRSFAAGTRLLYVFEVYGAARHPQKGTPRVSVDYVVERADGSIFAKVEPRSLTPGSQGELAQRLVLGLDTATPGEYQLLLHVRDEVAGKTLEVKDPFSVVDAGR